MFCAGNGLFLRVELGFELQKLRWIGVGSSDCRGGRRSSRGPRDLCLEVVNLARDFDYIGIVRRVLRLQLLLLRDESLEFLLPLIHRGAAGLGALHLMLLLRNHRLKESLVGLHMIQRLRNGAKLSGKRLKGALIRTSHGEAHIAEFDRLRGKSADVLLFELREFCVLLVQVGLGVGQLLLKEFRGAFRGFFAGIEVLADKQRGNLAARPAARSSRPRP